MRTTLDLPERLISKAMKTTGLKTKTQVIITALEQLIKKETLSQIKSTLQKWRIFSPLSFTERGRSQLGRGPQGPRECIPTNRPGAEQFQQSGAPT